MRLIFAFLSGSIFGLGLMVSGMTNPAKVQGWLDFFGAWDPTLAFVLGGAILPMVVAWRVAARRSPLLGGSFPAKPPVRFDRDLVLGSALFGLGWGLAGFCPGPAMASIGYGHLAVWIFVAAMLVGMALMPQLRRVLDGIGTKGYKSGMKISHLAPDFAVSPQITPEDVAALKQAGFTTIICNRPDAEVGPDLQAAVIREAAINAGMSFIEAPVMPGSMPPEALDAVNAALAENGAQVFAYCRSGTRSSFAWALAMAGTLPVAEILTAGQKAGYDLGSLGPALNARAGA